MYIIKKTFWNFIGTVVITLETFVLQTNEISKWLI